MITGKELVDEVLINRIIAGERDLYRILIERHQENVFSLGLSFFKNRDDAADFTQEVFLKAYKGLSGFQGRSRFSTWLYRIAYNTGINSLNRREEFFSLTSETDNDAEEIELPAPDNVEAELLRKFAMAAVREAMKTLPDRFRICLELYFFYDRSYDEIAIITGFPLNTVKSHIFRAKQLLREGLADMIEGGLE
ncbi:RNA polymerase sigma factor [Gracilinema caldarium]|uniref:RNA polymerase, sigma-24 subunit, ECF subfamily n=1 Tax=Gracilinema caldarium (strain ATCC 51460 / DSM 7334 / H1) TaxID=744872 RepID=F8EZY5_GRAC1|nr:sigma-70 family RNA polymerase sigma factor [Gracilinema caldarium]AEJ18498.1 RNA polymerase, sigma-24 subunit, ECF subfamily [Gracilinema caldarium DSM 7334]